jgi:hypothetical protein
MIFLLVVGIWVCLLLIRHELWQQIRVMTYLDFDNETYLASCGFSFGEQEILYQEFKLNMEHQR